MYPALLAARQEVPQVLQFYGMEFDTPAADHSTLMIPKSAAEEESLFQIETAYAKNEPWPPDPSRNTEPKMLEALSFMRQLAQPPVLFANHAPDRRRALVPRLRSLARPVCGVRTRRRSSATE